MAQIDIYTTQTCPYCVKAKRLLDQKDADYTEHDITGDDDARNALVAKAGGQRTVPQIFIGGTHVGGCDNLYALEEQGKLDAMLAA